MTGAERREQITAEIMERTGITEAMIERLVHGFYAKVRTDAVLAPIFEARIRDWEPHLAADVRVLVVGRADDGPLSRHADGQTSAAAGRCRSFRSLARAVRGHRPRDLSARGRSAFRGTGAADCGEPRTRHRRRAGRHARQRAKDFGVTRQEQTDDVPDSMS